MLNIGLVQFGEIGFENSFCNRNFAINFSTHSPGDMNVFTIRATGSTSTKDIKYD